MATNQTSEHPHGLIAVTPELVELMTKYDVQQHLVQIKVGEDRWALPCGIYRGLPVEVYNALPCVRATYLEIIANETASKAKDQIDHPDETTEAMAFGTAWHTAFLEPELFPLKYVLWDKKDEKGVPKRRAGNEWKAFEAANADKTILRTEDYANCLGMAKTLQAHPEVVKLFRRGPENEATLIWIDKITNLACKARIDAFVEDEAPTCGDLKSTASANPEAFKHKSLVQFGYDVQAGHYCSGVYHLLNPSVPPNFLIAASEKKRPWDCCFMEIQKRTMRVGWIRARAALDIYARCVRTGEWPSYPQDIIPLDAPEWWLKQHGDQGATRT